MLGSKFLVLAASTLLLAACAHPPPTPAPQPAAPPPITENTPCEAAGGDAPICRLPVDDLTEAAAAVLGDHEIVLVREGDVATILTRSQQERPTLCCFVNAPLSHVAADIWAARYRMHRLDEAALMLLPPDLLSVESFSSDRMLHWRGPQAPAAPEFEEDIEGAVLERTLWSDALCETRKLVIYLPPGHDPTRSYPALFMADGDSVGYFASIVEPLIDRGVIEPIVMVGAASGQGGIVEDRSALGIADLRSADYLPHFDGAGDRYEQHMRFFTEELVAYAMREFAVTDRADRRAVAGFSNGGSFALYAGLRHPDVFGAAIPMSPGWESLTAEDFHPSARARFYISAGLFEVGRARRARSYADELSRRGFDVVFENPATGHTDDQSSLVLSRALPHFFPGPSAQRR